VRENMIAKLKHYSYALYYDIRKFKYVRDFFKMYPVFIGLTWFIMSLGTPVSILAPFILTMIFTLMFLIIYFKDIYPRTTRTVKEFILRKKYPYLYKKMANKERI